MSTDTPRDPAPPSLVEAAEALWEAARHWEEAEDARFRAKALATAADALRPAEEASE